MQNTGLKALYFVIQPWRKAAPECFLKELSPSLCDLTAVTHLPVCWMTAAVPRPSQPQCCALLLQHHCFDDQPPAHSYRRCARQLPPAAAMHYANGARGRGFCNFSTCFTSGKMAAYELSPALLYLHFLVWSRSRGAGDINILRNTF